MADNRKAQCLLVMATPSSDVARRWKNALRDFCVVRSVSDLQQARMEVDEWKPSVILFDLSLPPINGVDRFSILLKNSGASRVIVFSEQPSSREAVEALKAGASGYAHRDLDPVLLKKAIEVVRKGELWVSRKTVAHMVQELAGGESEEWKSSTRLEPRRRQFFVTRKVELNRLTSREQEIAFLIGNGSSNKEIAGLLKISESTVKAHLSAIYHKLGLLDRLSLALFVAQQLRNVEQREPSRVAHD